VDEDKQERTTGGDRHNLNELGTGGLMGPVALYREK
jgi:hypothetical protein